MYESFYNLKEKPFTLLPDPGFLYLSDKHRMALTMLEYGLMNNAGFTVISGEIGAGKTTLIRHILNNIDKEHTVGLITNTHRSFGELLEWILLAFDLDHKGMNKVEMYQRFVDFIINEYAHNRQTVLIVDEAQNMEAETLEELRMLSNINADKDQALQVILVGQRELRETLQRPDLVQFAQRITVDYHLAPLSAAETAAYIRHRLQVAGGSPSIFSDLACEAVHRYSNGVPRLINLLCDTALVYGFAEQKHVIDARLVADVAREKQQGGIFPVFADAGADEYPEESQPSAPPVADATAAAETAGGDSAPARTEDNGQVAAAGAGQDSNARIPAEPVSEQPDATTGIPAAAEPDPDDLYRWQQDQGKKKLRIALSAAREELCGYLSRLLESYGFDVVLAAGHDASALQSMDLQQADLLLIDRDTDKAPLPAALNEFIRRWQGPVLYNDEKKTEASLLHGNPDFGKELADRIHMLAEPDAALAANR